MSKQTPKQQSLCNNKFDGLMNAAPHKRYKSFAVTVADWESVWLDCDPNQPLPDEGVISVWPEEMFAAAVCTDKPFFKMDVHDFCDLLGAHPDATIRVFPNGKNWTDMAAEDLLEDVLGWVAVLIGSVIIRYTGWYFIDPLLSVGIGVFILTNVCRNLYTIFRILLQAAPEHMPEDKIKAILQEVPNVKDVHDLHVWTLDGERNIASAHLIVADDISRADAIRVKHDAVDRLKGVGIDHLTVEVEFEGEGCYSCPVE